MKKVVIFGTGKLFEKLFPRISSDVDVIALIDNDSKKWEMKLHNIPVYSPDYALQLAYDYIYIMISKYCEVRKQLRKIGVDEYKIYDISRGELIVSPSPVVYYQAEVNENAKKGHRILVISHALSSTGAQNVLFTAVSSFLRRGYRVTVLSLDDGIQRDKYVQMGSNVVISGDILSHDEEWRKLVNNSDFIWVNTIWMYNYVYTLCLYDKPVVWWLHETLESDLIPHYMISTINCNDNINLYAVSRLVRRQFQGLFILKNINVFEYGIPKYEMPYVKHKNTKIVFAMIGGLSESIKGQDIFLKAVEKLSDSDKNKASFLIIGGGELNSHSMALIDKLECVDLKGEIPHERIPELYAMIDVVVCASRKEALSVVITEAFMNGKFVIVSSSAGNVDYMVPYEDGLVFQSENIDALAKQIHWTIEHGTDVERMGQNSRRVYEQYFSMEIFEKRLEEILSIYIKG